MEPLKFMPAPPWRFCCIDLETDNGRPDEVEREVALTFRGFLTLKPETAGRKYFEAIEAKKEKLALLNGAPIRVVTIRSDSAFLCLHDLAKTSGEPQARIVAGFPAIVQGLESERALLLALRQLLDERVAEETTIVGHNIRHFDLRKLRHRFLKNGLQLPAALAWKEQPTFDTMKHYCDHVSLRGEIMISLAHVLDELGLVNHKLDLDGSQVPRYIAEGRHDELIDYALKDVLAEAELYLRLAGQAGDVEPAVTA